MSESRSGENADIVAAVRGFLLFNGIAYSIWMCLVAALFRASVNALSTGIPVSGCALAIWALSYRSARVRRNLSTLSVLCAWLITLHYFYLFSAGAGDSNWVIGTFVIVVMAGTLFTTTESLIYYSIAVAAVSIALAYQQPPLRTSVFLPGLLIVLLHANLSKRARMKIHKNLADTANLFQLLFNASSEGILVHSHRRIVNVNEAFIKLIGGSREELIGTDALDFIDPDDRVIAIANMNRDEVAPYETRGFTKDGRSIALEVRAKVFQYGDQPARFVTVRDMSDRKKLEEERILAVTMAENVRIRDEFISIASHELKTPITGLKLQTQIIERDLRRPDATFESALGSPDRIRDLMALYRRQIDRLVELVDSMLDASRISAGSLMIECGLFDLAQLIREVATSLKAQDTGVVPISIQLPEQLAISADRSRIQQVVENLLTNAIKYGDGKPIRVSLRSDDAGAVFAVEDRGIGIAKENLEKIFERFERAVPSRNISGLGLGLYISRQIVNAHGGDITVTSEIGNGSTFSVRLPSTPAAASESLPSKTL